MEVNKGDQRRRSTRLAVKMKSEPPPPAGTKVQRQKKTKLLDMNDYCIDEICEWLPLDALAALGTTCKRMNHVASSYFRRKYPAKYLLLMNYKGKLNLYPDQLYVKCFSDHFRSIMIHGDDMNVFRYVAKTFKATQLKRVSICAANLTNAHTKCIRGVIEHAEIVELIRCSFAGSLNDFLTHCSNMKHLALKSITECTKYGTQNQWLLNKYQTLNHLHWGMQGPLSIKLVDFFKNNPNVNSFYADERILPFMNSHNIKINQLILKISTEEVEQTFIALKELCDQNAVQSLYLMGDLRRLNFSNNQIPKLKELQGIYKSGLTTETISLSFSHLKLINMEITSFKQATVLAKQLSSLEEAYLTVQQIDLILPFVRFTPKLTKIYIGNTSAMKQGAKLSPFNLNKQRNKLIEAANVTIYLKDEAYFKIKQMSPGYGKNLVEVKSIEAHIPSNVFVYTFLDN